MIAIEQLRYVRLGTRDLEAAGEFAQRVLGLQQIDKTAQQVSFRSDFRDHTLVYTLGDPAEQAIGLEVRKPETLRLAAAALAESGLPAVAGTPDEVAARRVKEFIWFKDHSGNRFELVVRPLNSGWRYFPSRDAGIKGLAAVALRTTTIEADERLWTHAFDGRVSDWAGASAYLRFDETHHRLALHPSQRNGVLALEYQVENVDLLMQNSYYLQSIQTRIVHGPGRRPTSNQLFVTFRGPDDVLFSFVAEGDAVGDEATHRPRQLPAGRAGYCGWGSECEVPEFQEPPRGG